jgi:hemerythrin-like domain-containing protein
VSFDAFVQVLEGAAELTIGGEKVIARVGETVRMPAGVPHAVRAIEPFKMILSMLRDWIRGRGRHMLTRLGKPAAPRDAVDFLLECHDRIRAFLELARRLARDRTAQEGEVRDAAERVRRYFTQALPLHARDEEESLLPRLRGLDPAVDAELEAMAREHGEHGRPLRALVDACEVVAGDAKLHREIAPEIAAATAELGGHFARHLRREEEVIFPAVRRLLDARADAQIVRELRARRGVVEQPLARASRAG